MILLYDDWEDMTRKRGFVLIMNNLCCCNLLLKLALSDIGKKNDYRISALATCCADVTGDTRACMLRTTDESAPDSAPCIGIKKGTYCGALAAAIAVLYSEKNREEAETFQDELMDWFEDSFGGYDCETIAADIDAVRDELCPKLIFATYLRLRGYLDPDNHLSQKTLI
jgi:hypothetical protein